MSSRDAILNKLRAARRPFEDAPPRPKHYLNVTTQDDESTPALIERFVREFTNVNGKPIVTANEDEARTTVIDLLKRHDARCIIAWDFQHIPISGLAEAIKAAGIEVIHPDAHDEFRAEMLDAAEAAQVGLTGVDAAAATTATMVFTTAPGKGRIPTILAPVHIAVIRTAQMLPRLESWVAAQRAHDPQLGGLTNSANFCFITGPSRTGDIEMELILGVHGPGTVYAVIVP